MNEKCQNEDIYKRGEKSVICAQGFGEPILFSGLSNFYT